MRDAPPRRRQASSPIDFSVGRAGALTSLALATCALAVSRGLADGFLIVPRHPNPCAAAGAADLLAGQLGLRCELSPARRAPEGHGSRVAEPPGRRSPSAPEPSSVFHIRRR